jgi:rhodanese-related sulfurtransferase
MYSMKEKSKIGFIAQGIPNVTPKEALDLCRKSAEIIDIRPDYTTAYKKFKVPKVLYFPRNRGPVRMEELIKSKIYIVAGSTTSIHSREAAKEMRANGFDHVYNLAGGITEWEKDELPLEIDNKARLSGSCTCQLKYRG